MSTVNRGGLKASDVALEHLYYAPSFLETQSANVSVVARYNLEYSGNLPDVATIQSTLYEARFENHRRIKADLKKEGVDDLVDLEDISETLKKLNPRLRIALTKMYIKEMLDLANLLDRQIRRLTNESASLIVKFSYCKVRNEYECLNYSSFKFSTGLWKKKSKDLQDDCSLNLLAADLIECRLDLIEALSEFNISENLLKSASETEASSSTPERLINRLKLPRAATPYQQRILEESKNTLKGDLFLTPQRFVYADVLDEKPTLCYPDMDPLGPFVDVLLKNKESDDWNMLEYPRYYRRLTDNLIHADFLIQANQGERFCIVQDGGRESLILRCRTHGVLCEDQRDSFEYILAYRLIASGSSKIEPLSHEKECFHQRTLARKKVLDSIDAIRGCYFLNRVKYNFETNAVLSNSRCSII